MVGYVRCSVSQRQHLSVRTRITRCNGLIKCLSYDFITLHNHRTHWHFIALRCPYCERHSFTHKANISLLLASKGEHRTESGKINEDIRRWKTGPVFENFKTEQLTKTTYITRLCSGCSFARFDRFHTQTNPPLLINFKDFNSNHLPF